MSKGAIISDYVLTCLDCYKDYDLKKAEAITRKAHQKIVRCPHCNCRKGTI